MGIWNVNNVCCVHEKLYAEQNIHSYVQDKLHIYIYVYVEHQVSRCMFHFGFIVVNYLYIYMTVRGYNYALVLFKNPLVKK